MKARIAKEVAADADRLRRALINLVTSVEVNTAAMPRGLMGVVTSDEFTESQRIELAKAVARARAELGKPSAAIRIIEGITHAA